MGRPVAPLARLVAAGLALSVAGTAAWVATRDGPPAATTAPAAGYRITYDVRSPGTTASEVVEVLGPVSRRVAGETGTATTATGVYDRSGGSWRQLAAVAPGEVGSRLQADVALRWAATVGLARPDGTGDVAGVACTWWLTREPLDAGDVAAPTATDRTRSCVDAHGRLLADEWRSGGALLRRRDAVRVEELRSLDPFDGAVPQALDPRLATTAVEARDAQGAPPPGCRWTSASIVLEAAPGTTELARRTSRQVAECGTRLVVLDDVEDLTGPVAPRGLPGPTVGGLASRVRGTAGGVVVEVVVDGRLRRVRSGLPLADVVGWLAGAVR